MKNWLCGTVYIDLQNLWDLGHSRASKYQTLLHLMGQIRLHNVVNSFGILIKSDSNILYCNKHQANEVLVFNCPVRKFLEQKNEHTRPYHAFMLCNVLLTSWVMINLFTKKRFSIGVGDTKQREK